MREQTDRRNISLPLQSHPNTTEERRERPALRPSIPPDRGNPKRQPTKASYNHEQDLEHIERINDDHRPTHLEVQRSSFSSSTTVDTVEFVRKIAAGERKLPVSTTIAATDKPKPPRPKRWFRRVGVLCSIFALLVLVIIPVVCVCILTGVFVPDEARTKHGKMEHVTTRKSETVPSSTISTKTATTTSHSSLRSTVDHPNVTWLAATTKTGPEVTWLTTATETGSAGGLNAVTSAADADRPEGLASEPSLQERDVAAEALTTMETRRVKPSLI